MFRLVVIITTDHCHGPIKSKPIFLPAHAKKKKTVVDTCPLTTASWGYS